MLLVIGAGGFTCSQVCRLLSKRGYAVVAILFARIQARKGWVPALFLLRYGVDFAPYIYLFLGTLTFASTLVAGLIGLLLFERATSLYTEDINPGSRPFIEETISMLDSSMEHRIPPTRTWQSNWSLLHRSGRVNSGSYAQ